MATVFTHTIRAKHAVLMTCLTILVASSALVALPGITRAQQANPIQEYTLLEPLPCIPNKTKDSTGKVVESCAAGTQITSVKFETYVQYIFNLAIAIAAVAAVFMIVFGGFQYMTTDSWQGKTAGLDKFKGAVTGLLLVLCSYLILRTINPKLVEINTSGIVPLKVQQSAWSTYYNSILPQLTAMTKEKVAENNALIAQNKTYSETLAKLRKDVAEICTAMGETDEEECYTSSDPEVRSAMLQIAQYQNQLQQNSAKIERNIFENEVIVETKKVQGPGTPTAYITTALGRLDTLYKNAAATVSDPATLADLKTKKDDANLALIKEYSKLVVESNAPFTATDLPKFQNYFPEDPLKKQQAITYVDKIIDKKLTDQEEIENATMYATPMN